MPPSSRGIFRVGQKALTMSLLIKTIRPVAMGITTSLEFLPFGRKRIWTAQAVINLLKGMNCYGKGKWLKIYNSLHFS